MFNSRYRTVLCFTGLMVALGVSSAVSQPGEISLQTIEDAAGMFNERGYLKSNSVVFDGKEAINDFNGNLMYTQVLERIPLSQNGLNCELKLTYNGSVGHVSPAGLKRDNPDIKRVSLNMPEWILSLNNIAIQVLNFENDPVSWPTVGAGQTESEDEDVVALVNGYHTCYSFNNFTSPKHGTISILMGDGTVRQFVSLASGEGQSMTLGGGVFTGEYRTLSKDDQAKGLVTSGGNFYLFEPDGSYVRFILEYASWRRNPADLNTAAAGVDDSIIVATPLLFWNRHGGLILVDYFYGSCPDIQTIPGCGDIPACCSDGRHIYGRRPVKMIDFASVSEPIKFSWDPFTAAGGMEIRHGQEQPWTIYYNTQIQGGGSYPGGCDEANRAYIYRIVDPEGRRTNFEYSAYRRQATGVGNGYATGYKDACDELGGTTYTYVTESYDVALHRLHKITYPNGGQSIFSYYGDDYSVWPADPAPQLDDLTVDFTSCYATPPPHPCNKSSIFDDIGRDPFFVNMVVAVRRLTHDGQGYNDVVSTDSLIFDWVDNADVGQIGANDVFTTVHMRGEGNDFSNQTYKSLTNTYQHFPEPGPYSDLERDRGWVVKLVESVEDNMNEHGESIDSRTTEYSWETANYTFQLAGKETHWHGVTAETTYEYDWVGDDTATAQSNMLWSRAVDPWGTVTETFYNDDNLDATSTVDMYYQLVDSVRTKVARPGSYQDDTTTIGLLAYEYYGLSDTNGIFGQLKSSTEYVYDDHYMGMPIDSIVNQFTYYTEPAPGGIRSLGAVGAVRKQYLPSGDSVEYQFGDLVHCEYNRLNLDSSITKALLPFAVDNRSWYKKTAYLSNDLYLWDTIVQLDTTWTTVVCNRSLCFSGSNWAVIPCDQEVHYELCIGKSNCDDGEVNDVWITVDGTTVDSIYCTGSDRGDKWSQGTLLVEADDLVMLHISSTNCSCGECSPLPPVYAPPYKANRAKFTYFNCSGGHVDTVGVREKDAVVAYQHVDERGLPQTLVGANLYSTDLEFDGLQRVEQVSLPGSYESDAAWGGNPIPVTLTVTPIFDAELLENNAVEDCYSWEMELHGEYGQRSEQKVYLSFENADLSDLQQVDSAFLYLNCKESYATNDEDIALGGCLTLYPDCDGTAQPQVSTTGYSDIGPGIVKLDVSAFVQGWMTLSVRAFVLHPDYDEQVIVFSSTEDPDSSIRPRLEIFGKTPPGDPSNPRYYSMKFSYDDDPGILTGSDGDGVASETEVRCDPTGYGITSDTWFDGFGRAIKAGNRSSTSEYDSVMTSYDFADRLVSTTDQLGNTTTVEYDGYDRTIKRTLPDSFFKSAVYEGTTASALGLDTLFDMRNPGIFMTSIANEDSNIVIEYSDVRNRLRLKMTESDTLTDEYTYFDYDLWGNLTTVIKPNGDSVNYRYNSLGQLVKEWSSDYDTVFFRYDKNGHMVLKKDGNLDFQDVIDDSTLAYSDGVFLNDVGDDQSEPLVVGVPGIVHYSIGMAGSGSYALSYVSIEKNDQLMEQVSWLDGLDVTKSGCFYVGCGDTVNLNAHWHQGAAPDSIFGAVEYWVYDDTDWWTFYDYDPVGRITLSGRIKLEETCNDDSCWFSDTISQSNYRKWFYDQSLSELSNGLLSLTFDDLYDYAEKYDYDARGRVTKQTDYFDASLWMADRYPDSAFCKYDYYVQPTASAFEIGYQYNLADKVTRVNYPDTLLSTLHFDVTYHYDDKGRLSSVGRVLDGSEDDDFFAAFSYTERDEIDTMYLGGYDSTQVVDYAYNERGWLTAINPEVADSGVVADRFRQTIWYYELADSGWTGHKNGNVVAQKLVFADSDSLLWHYEYDNLDRLTLSEIGSSSEAFTYDKNGNRNTRTTDGIHVWSYNNTAGTNQLDNVTVAGITYKQYVYDANGNVTWANHGGPKDLSLDVYNQLTCVYDQNTTLDQIRFGYSPSGLRVWKLYYYEVDPCLDSTGGGEPEMLMMMPPPPDTCEPYYESSYTYYVRGQNGEVLAEYTDLEGDPSARYVYADGQRIAMVDASGNVYYYLNDHLGSAGVVVTSAGMMRDKYKYEAFGGNFGSSVMTDQVYRYTGKPLDEELGLNWYYYGVRYYDPWSGRFLSIDPMGGKYPSYSVYVYVLDNPLRLLDPDGLESYDPLARNRAQGIAIDDPVQDKLVALKHSVHKGLCELTHKGAGLSGDVSVYTGIAGGVLLIFPGTQAVGVILLATSTAAGYGEVGLDLANFGLDPNSDVTITSIVAKAATTWGPTKLFKYLRGLKAFSHLTDEEVRVVQGAIEEHWSGAQALHDATTGDGVDLPGTSGSTGSSGVDGYDPGLGGWFGFGIKRVIGITGEDWSNPLTRDSSSSGD